MCFLPRIACFTIKTEFLLKWNEVKLRTLDSLPNHSQKFHFIYSNKLQLQLALFVLCIQNSYSDGMILQLHLLFINWKNPGKSFYILLSFNLLIKEWEWMCLMCYLLQYTIEKYFDALLFMFDFERKSNSIETYSKYVYV